MKILACIFLLASGALVPSMKDISIVTVPYSADSVPVTPTVAPAAAVPHEPEFQYATDELWQYLREGLNYLESPKPLAPPECVPPSYVHPDMRGFGAYGFSPEAYADVRRLYPFFRNVAWNRVLKSGQLYELANQAFCDWLLAHLQEELPQNPTKAEIFDAVQQAWNLGLGGFKNGRKVVASRTHRSNEFLSRHL